MKRNVMRDWLRFAVILVGGGGIAASIFACDKIKGAEFDHFRTPMTASFSRCIDGIASAEDAIEVGRAIGEHFYDLRFDARLISTQCADQITADLFQAYDSSVSVRLISFLWNGASLRKLLSYSSKGANRLACDFVCMLVNDRRPLLDLLLFNDLLKDGKSLALGAAPEFLLARSVVNNSALSRQQLNEIMGFIGNTYDKDQFVKNLFLIASPAFIRTAFELTGDHLCFSHYCVPTIAAGVGKSCQDVQKGLSTPANLDEAIGIKVWAVGSGRDDLYDCTSQAVRDSTVAQLQVGLVRDEFNLSLFDPELNLPDVIAGLRSGAIHTKGFLDGGLMASLDLAKIQSVSWPFADAIVGLLEHEGAEKSLSLTPAVKALLEQTPSASRLQVVLCRAGPTTPDKATKSQSSCDARRIYLSAMDSIAK